jgi:hypothetical protein
VSTSSSGHQHSGRDSLVKVTFLLEKTDWHDHGTETMWAEPRSSERFSLRNVPFYAYGVSYGDVVGAVADEGSLTVREVVGRGGHSTYRLFVTNTEELQRFEEFWQPLERLGCTVERATERLFAVDVPPNADINAAYDALSQGEAAGVWDFEEAHLGHPLRNRA